MATKAEHTQVVDDALDAMASDPDVTEEEYREALEDIGYRIEAAKNALRTPAV